MFELFPHLREIKRLQKLDQKNHLLLNLVLEKILDAWIISLNDSDYGTSSLEDFEPNLPALKMIILDLAASKIPPISKILMPHLAASTIMMPYLAVSKIVMPYLEA